MLPLMSDFTIVIDAPNLSGSKLSKTDVSIKHKDQEMEKKSTHNWPNKRETMKIQLIKMVLRREKKNLKEKPRIGNMSLHTSKKGLVSNSPCSDFTCFNPSRAGVNALPSILLHNMYSAHNQENSQNTN